MAIKRKAAEAIRNLVPTYLVCKYYVTNDDETIVDEMVKDMLDPLDDLYMNKHLVYSILELILVRLIPELGEQSTSDLLAQRGVDWAGVDMVDDGGNDKCGREL